MIRSAVNVCAPGEDKKLCSELFHARDINNPPRLGAGNTDWRSGRASGFRINIAATQLRKNAKNQHSCHAISRQSPQTHWGIEVTEIQGEVGLRISEMKQDATEFKAKK